MPSPKEMCIQLKQKQGKSPQQIVYIFFDYLFFSYVPSPMPIQSMNDVSFGVNVRVDTCLYLKSTTR